jgi:hypothetical protein
MFLCLFRLHKQRTLRRVFVLLVNPCRGRLSFMVFEAFRQTDSNVTSLHSVDDAWDLY